MFSREELLQQARQAALRAHAPYSHFRVGAVLVAGDQVFTGVNVEISSYGLTLCAERAALAAAVTAGADPITQVAVACIDAPAEAPANERTPWGLSSVAGRSRAARNHLYRWRTGRVYCWRFAALCLWAIS